MSLRREQCEDGIWSPGYFQRKASYRLMPAIQQLVPQLTDGWVRRDIIADDGFQQAQCSTGRALAFGGADLYRELDALNVGFFAAMPGNYLAFQGLPIHYTNPGHSKRPRLDRDAASFPEQIAAVSYLHGQSGNL